jgi:hypothetical protein
MGPVFEMLRAYRSGQGKVAGTHKCSNEPLGCHKVLGI